MFSQKMFILAFEANNAASLKLLNFFPRILFHYIHSQKEESKEVLKQISLYVHIGGHKGAKKKVFFFQNHFGVFSDEAIQFSSFFFKKMSNSCLATAKSLKF